VTPRERYLETLLFGTPDKIPFKPGGPREKTLKRWWGEGLPQEGSWFIHLCHTIGLTRECRKMPLSQPGVNFRMNPIFEEMILTSRTTWHSTLAPERNGRRCAICFRAGSIRQEMTLSYRLTTGEQLLKKPLRQCNDASGGTFALPGTKNGLVTGEICSVWR